jgi:8-oxo-dGTP pyrophosphatase MutT (NUDIX family)
MHSAVMAAQSKGKNEPRLATAWARVGKRRSSTKFIRLAELRRLTECEQVAAVCYRLRGGNIEFLLVRTGKGRWIFPKGSVEPGLTHAQAAALEAFEEAGVHGRIEEASFTSYVRRGRRQLRNSAERLEEKESAVNAHLCEVLRLVQPLELDRNPTWFAAEKAKHRLQEGRTADFGTELARVVDRAVSRVRRFRDQNAAVAGGRSRQRSQVRGQQNDGLRGSGLQSGSFQSRGLQKVQFIDIGRVRETAGRSKVPRTG